LKLVQLVTWQDNIIALDDEGSLYRITFNPFGHPSITLLWKATSIDE